MNYTRILVVVTFWFAACALCRSTPPPADLLVSGIASPQAIDPEPPLFTWAWPVAVRGQMQTARQILVASRPEILESGRGDVWDSGKVESQKSAAVEYQGPALAPAMRYWWKVRVWDQAGNATSYSQPAVFVTGLARSDWTARYIWDGTANLNNFAYFRKAFQISHKVASARVFVSAHNDYLLYLNGKQLGMGPARSNPCAYGQYNAYDITPDLKPGLNAFAAVGHWLGSWKDSGINAEPAFILEARITFDDGSSLIVPSDASWKTMASTPYVETEPVFFGGAGGAKNRAAIVFDARREPEGWTAPGFDDTAWPRATVVDRSKFSLYAQRVAPQAEQSELEPLRLSREGDAQVADFGRCLCGWPKLTMHRNRPGDVIRVSYCQTEGTKGNAGWDQYICKGGVETWKPSIGRHTSFRLLRITGYAGELGASDVRAVWAYSGAQVAGAFRCSSPLLNDIFTLCERSARQNVQQGIISVDANREQSPWTADSWNIGNGLLYNHRNTQILDKVIRDYAAEQLPSGDFYACSPAMKFHIPEWSMYWPMLLWQQYLFSGDEALLRSMRPRLLAFLNWIQAFEDSGTHLIDPPNGNFDAGHRISEYAGGKMPSGGVNIATNCQYYENLRIAARIAAVLGQAEESSRYTRQAQAVKNGINQNLFNGTYYLARTDRQEMFPLASAWALRFDLVPEQARPGVLEAIRKAGTPDLGGYGGDAFYNGIFQAGGMGDFAAADLRRYEKMVRAGANWESFGDRGEYNHAWTAYPAYLFPKYYAGIQPTGGGFATFDVRSETAGLTFAESTVPTVKGDIHTRWEKTAPGTLVLSITVPANTQARIFIPKPPASLGRLTITESGKVLWSSSGAGSSTPGIVFLGEQKDCIQFSVGAGQYRFTAHGE